jgi:nitric oxide reductase subunit B
MRLTGSFSLGGGFYAMKNGSNLVAGVTLLVYIIYIATAVWTFYSLLSIPEKVVTKSG